MRGIVGRAMLAVTVVLLAATGVPGGVGADPPSRPYACTGFAVYGPTTLYGMNFDYPELDVHLSLTPYVGRSVYRLEFAQGGGYASVVGMNSDGLFASCQMLYPEGAPRSALAAGEVYVWQAFEHALESYSSVQQFVDYLSGATLVPSKTSLHILCADASGEAVVAEPGEQGNVLTRIDGRYLVMTNFANGAFQGQDYRSVSGAGADRYRVAYARIRDTLATFDVERALDVLRATSQGGQWTTQASQVFDPAAGVVYLALDRDYERLWSISLRTGTVQAFRGLPGKRKLELGAEGLTEGALLALGQRPAWPWALGGGVVVAAAALALWRWRVKFGRGRRD